MDPFLIKLIAGIDEIDGFPFLGFIFSAVHYFLKEETCDVGNQNTRALRFLDGESAGQQIGRIVELPYGFLDALP